MTLVLLAVGCLECREQTRVLGVYEDELMALCAFEDRATTKQAVDIFGDPDLPPTCIRSDMLGRIQLHKSV